MQGVQFHFVAIIPRLLEGSSFPEANNWQHGSLSTPKLSNNNNNTKRNKRLFIISFHAISLRKFRPFPCFIAPHLYSLDFPWHKFHFSTNPTTRIRFVATKILCGCFKNKTTIGNRCPQTSPIIWDYTNWPAAKKKIKQNREWWAYSLDQCPKCCTCWNYISN